MEQDKEYKVSVIVPIYNVEPYLKKAVDSLLAQTLDCIEIILVDDGSPDGCGRIMDDYERQYEHIVTVHKPNGGLSDARNAGLAVARGKYIGFVDPDDYVEPDMYERLYLSAEKYHTDLVFCGYEEVFSLTLIEQRDVPLPECAKAELAIERFIMGGYGAYAWNKLYSRKLIEAYGLRFPVGIHLVEDCVFLCHYLQHVKTVSNIKGSYYHYIRNPNSLCAKYHPNQFELYRAGYEAQKRLLQARLPDEALAEHVEKTFLTTALHVIGQINSRRHRASLRKRYAETLRVLRDGEVQTLIGRFCDALENREDRKLAALAKQNKFFSLFLHELWKMRVIDRLRYYFG